MLVRELQLCEERGLLVRRLLLLRTSLLIQGSVFNELEGQSVQ